MTFLTVAFFIHLLISVGIIFLMLLHTKRNEEVINRGEALFLVIAVVIPFINLMILVMNFDDLCPQEVVDFFNAPLFDWRKKE